MVDDPSLGLVEEVVRQIGVISSLSALEYKMTKVKLKSCNLYSNFYKAFDGLK